MYYVLCTLLKLPYSPVKFAPANSKVCEKFEETVTLSPIFAPKRKPSTRFTNARDASCVTNIEIEAGRKYEPTRLSKWVTGISEALNS